MAKMHITTTSRIGADWRTESNSYDISVELPAEKLGECLRSHLQRVMQPLGRRTPRPASIRDMTTVVVFETQEV